MDFWCLKKFQPRSQHRPPRGQAKWMSEKEAMTHEVLGSLIRIQVQGELDPDWEFFLQKYLFQACSG